MVATKGRKPGIENAAKARGGTGVGAGDELVEESIRRKRCVTLPISVAHS
jgi:hypothetical protein